MDEKRRHGRTDKEGKNINLGLIIIWEVTRQSKFGPKKQGKFGPENNSAVVVTPRKEKASCMGRVPPREHQRPGKQPAAVCLTN